MSYSFLLPSSTFPYTKNVASSKHERSKEAPERFCYVHASKIKRLCWRATITNHWTIPIVSLFPYIASRIFLPNKGR